jgi:branched-chain amino acid transport system permease protein
MSARGSTVRWVRVALWIAGIAIFLAIPRIVEDQYLMHLAVLSMLFAIVASNWDLTLGYAGVFNFAHIAFFALGAYTSGILTVRLGISPWLGIIAGAIVAVVVYVALLTFAFTQLASALIISQTTITGGLAGLVGVPGLSFGEFQFREHIDAYFYLVGLLLLASTLFLRRIVSSDFGLSLVALRDFEEYAVSRGVPLARQRFLAFLFSAIFTGAAGAVYVHYLLVASPDVFGFSLTTLFLSMILVGGAATVYGPILAGILLTYVSELMAPLGPIRFMILAVLIIVTMLFAPQGIWGFITATTSRMRQARPMPPRAQEPQVPVAGEEGVNRL